MRNRYINTIVLALPLVLFFSCNSWLDVMPDNRTEIDTAEKVYKLLVSAYPEAHYVLCAEYSSDNVDDYGESNPNSARIIEEIYAWEDVTETDNEAPKSIWSSCYNAISNANQALVSIDALGNTEELKAARGEALLCRAYCHFVLAGLFCEAYSPQTASDKLGIPYMDAPETQLNPKYSRGTLADVYNKIAADIEEGLPLIDNSAYSVQKYHFNRSAAYTFASRFYLFYGDWDKVIEYATTALGNAPAEMLRDYGALAELPQNEDVLTVQYNNTVQKNNFLIQTGYSSLGLYIGPYYAGKRHTHGQTLMTTEVLNSAPWGRKPVGLGEYDYLKMYRYEPLVYSATNLDFIMFARIPNLFEYVDPVSGMGYSRTNLAILTAEEALLNRAEAYALKENYKAALADMNLWTVNTLDPSNCSPVLTETGIRQWAEGLAYYSPMQPTPKKQLNPLLFTLEQNSIKEAFIHAILYMRRIEFMHYGMRWFDVKRYGIEIARRTISATSVEPVSLDDVLTKDDSRRALQLPKDVITAGLAPNPR